LISICHLITDLNLGGTETALLRLLTRMDRREFSNTVLALTGPGTLVPRFAEAGVPVITLGSERSIGPGGFVAAFRAVRRLRPTILQTWLYHADFIGMIVARLARVPALAWNIRCAELERTDHPASLFWFLRMLAAGSSAPRVVVANSRAGIAAHEALGYKPRRWQLIPNGFDVGQMPSAEAASGVRRALGVGADVPLVGLIARYHVMKDHRTFLAAAAQVAAAVPAVRFVLAGRGIGRENAELMQHVQALGLAERVHLLGEVAAPAEVMAALDVAVSSSYSEAFPNVLGEAMAAGVPIVATDAGDSRHIIGEAGRVVPVRDPGAMAAAIIGWLTLPAEERRRRGAAGRSRILEEFSLDAIVEQYEVLYRQLAAEARSHQGAN
jgi:glycosyltransferase involved in cell wall biosynthesis